MGENVKLKRIVEIEVIDIMFVLIRSAIEIMIYGVRYIV